MLLAKTLGWSKEIGEAGIGHIVVDKKKTRAMEAKAPSWNHRQRHHHHHQQQQGEEEPKRKMNKQSRTEQQQHPQKQKQQQQQQQSGTGLSWLQEAMAAAAEAQKKIEQEQEQQKQLEQQRQQQQQQQQKRDEEKKRQDALKLQRTSSGLSWLDEAMEAAKAAIGQGGEKYSTASVFAAAPSGLRPRLNAKKRTWREMEEEEEGDSDYVPDDEEDLDEEDEEETEDDDDLMDNSEEDFRHGQTDKENRRSLSGLDDDSFLKEQRDRLRSLCRRNEKGMLVCPLCPWEQTSSVFAHLLEHMVVNHFYREIAGRHGMPQRHFGGKRGGAERGGDHPCTLCTDGRVFSRWVTITIIIFFKKKSTKSREKLYFLR